MKSNDNYRGHSAEMREAERIARQYDNQRSIQEENEVFAAMTPAEKRVRIARDVLLWIKLGRIVPDNMNYMTVVDEGGHYVAAPTVNGFTCHACALGSVFAVAVERGAVTPPNGNINAAYDYHMRASLEPYFDEDQLRMIEDAFEGFESSGDRDARLFCADLEKYGEGARLRMERIMRNIIANGGEFVP